MAEQKPSSQPEAEEHAGITRITVAGFKSIVQEQSIEVRPLTILAGVNSSGKSSIMQPLLLLKQTLDATYDPGALLLNGPNVRFTSIEQMLSHSDGRQHVKGFHVGAEISNGNALTTYFTRGKNKRIDIERTVHAFKQGKYDVYIGMPSSAIHTAFSIFTSSWPNTDEYAKDELRKQFEMNMTVSRNRCFLLLSNKPDAPITFDNEPLVDKYIRQIIHLPHDLTRLGLTGGIAAEPIDDTQIELLVHRYSRKDTFNPEDMVSIADVGLGISQTLPVIVALHAASPDQLIYVEQPELHLHPRAQSAMAEVLADAAIEGARMVVETHSSLFLLGIQTLVAEGKLPPELVKLHWFKLLDDGSTQIVSADLDETGAFGDWPVDFADVALSSEGRYLDAAQARMMKGS